MKVAVSIEPDDYQKNFYMLVIRHDKSHELISIPLRGLSEGEAVRFQGPIQYAFEAGLRAQKESISKYLYKDWDQAVAEPWIC